MEFPFLAGSRFSSRRDALRFSESHGEEKIMDGARRWECVWPVFGGGCEERGSCFKII